MSLDSERKKKQKCETVKMTVFHNRRYTSTSKFVTFRWFAGSDHTCTYISIRKHLSKYNFTVDTPNILLLTINLKISLSGQQRKQSTN